MDKLKLDLDDLAVESLPTAPETTEAEGTVHGHDKPTYTGCSLMVALCPPPTPVV